METSAGIYVHLPYCRSRCGYCSFVVSTDDSTRLAYLSALEREIALVAPEAQEEGFDAIYFGGGTPSLVPPEALQRLLDRIRDGFDVSPAAEVTLEANPDDVTPELVSDWISAGVSRVSAGVQSFDDAELSAVGRRHDAACARRALDWLTSSGLSVSADLILGLPGQTAESFRRSLRTLLSTGIGHVSVYLLETDKSKSIEEDRSRHPERYLSDDAQADLWLSAGELLKERGYHHYEISNWSQPGKQARHNRKYWTRAPTLGFGVSSHEFWRSRRRANVAHLASYVSLLEQGRRPTAMDRPVDRDEEARERIVLGLRLAEGVGSEELEGWISRSEDATLSRDYAAWREGRLLEERAGRVHFTERGFLLSNEILCRFV